MKETHQVRFGKHSRLPVQFVPITNSRLQQFFSIRHFAHQKIAEVGQQIAAEVSQVVTAHDHVVYDGERLGGLAVGDAVDDSNQDIGAGNAQGHLNVLLLNLRSGK